MHNSPFDDEIWNEYQWEEYLDAMEDRHRELRLFINDGEKFHQPPWLRYLEKYSGAPEAVDAFIKEELQMEEDYWEEDAEWDEDDPEDVPRDEWIDDDFLDDFEEDDFDRGEQWKELSGDFSRSDNGSIENLAIYIHARETAIRLLEWAEATHPKFRTQAFDDFIQHSLAITARLASGYSYGFELDFLGANIAGTKKALYRANEALRLLEEELKQSPQLSVLKYKEMHERFFELRNDIGIYVQELRERFNRGVE